MKRSKTVTSLSSWYDTDMDYLLKLNSIDYLVSFGAKSSHGDFDWDTVSDYSNESSHGYSHSITEELKCPSTNGQIFSHLTQSSLDNNQPQYVHSHNRIKRKSSELVRTVSISHTNIKMSSLKHCSSLSSTSTASSSDTLATCVSTNTMNSKNSEHQCNSEYAPQWSCLDSFSVDGFHPLRHDTFRNYDSSQSRPMHPSIQLSPGCLASVNISKS
jgi:hypothetical protein